MKKHTYPKAADLHHIFLKKIASRHLLLTLPRGSALYTPEKSEHRNDKYRGYINKWITEKKRGEGVYKHIIKAKENKHSKKHTYQKAADLHGLFLRNCLCTHFFFVWHSLTTKRLCIHVLARARQLLGCRAVSPWGSRYLFLTLSIVWHILSWKSF